LKCCANIYFNRQRLIKNITPKYANIKIPHTSPATYVTQNKIQSIRLKDEIKFLHKKERKTKKSLEVNNKVLSLLIIYVVLLDGNKCHFIIATKRDGSY